MVFLAAGAVGWGSVVLTTMEPNDGAAINSSEEAPTPELSLLLSYCSLLFIPSHPHSVRSPFLFLGPAPSRLPQPLSLLLDFPPSYSHPCSHGPLCSSASSPLPFSISAHAFASPLSPSRPSSPSSPVPISVSPFSRFCPQLPPMSCDSPLSSLGCCNTLP